MKANSKYMLIFIVATAFGKIPCEGFTPQRGFPSTTSQSMQSMPKCRKIQKLNLSLDDVDAGFVGGSLLWGVNIYLGIDWLLAPLGVGLDSDFNPATRATTFLGKLTSGVGLDEALKGSQVLQDGERPEMGSRVGIGANVGYSVAGLEGMADDDWLAQRDAGLAAPAPLLLQSVVIFSFAVLGVILQSITNSPTTAGVLVIPALIYEIGRPSLPTKEEALLDLKIDNAVESFVNSSLLLYGQEPPEGLSPVKQAEATNERELVGAFRRKMQKEEGSDRESIKNTDVSDFQIEMRMRSYGSGRSEAGYIKGIRLL